MVFSIGDGRTDLADGVSDLAFPYRNGPLKIAVSCLIKLVYWRIRSVWPCFYVIRPHGNASLGHLIIQILS